MPPAERVEHRPPCERCGYDLTGLPSGRACPECGTVPARERFVCPACGQDLSNLPRGSACTACGVVTPADVTVVWGRLLAGWGNWRRGAGVERIGPAVNIAIVLMVIPLALGPWDHLTPARFAVRGSRFAC